MAIVISIINKDQSYNDIFGVMLFLCVSSSTTFELSLYAFALAICVIFVCVFSSTTRVKSLLVFFLTTQVFHRCFFFFQQ